MNAPINKLLEQVEWEELPEPDAGERDDLFATHVGSVQFGDKHLRCYQLNDGQRVFDAKDIAEFFGDLEGEKDA